MENERNMLTKGLQVLQHLSDRPEGDGVSGVARAIGVPVSTAHRLLATMTSTDWVARTPGATYRLGLQVLRAAESLRGSLGLSDLHGVLSDLSRRVGETVIFGTLVDQQFIYLDVLHGPGLLGIKGSAGRRGPLHCTATGKALLCGLEAARRAELIADLDLVPHTERTLTTVDGLTEEIALSITRGYTTAREEYEVGVTSVGVPIRLEQDPDGVYGVCISAPTQRAEDRVDEFVAALGQARQMLRTAGVSPR